MSAGPSLRDGKENGKWPVLRCAFRRFPTLAARQAKRRRARRQSRPRGAARKKLFAQFGIFPCRPGGTAPRRRRAPGALQGWAAFAGRAPASAGPLLQSGKEDFDPRCMQRPVARRKARPNPPSSARRRLPMVRRTAKAGTSAPPQGAPQPASPACYPRFPSPSPHPTKTKRAQTSPPSRAGRPSSGTHIQRRSL